MVTKLARFFLSGTFSLIASIASLAGFIVIFLKDYDALVIALIVFIVFLLIILYRVFQITGKFVLQKTGAGYHKFATYVRYTSTDGEHITYEVTKFIQCKSLIMDEHVHHFYWTGKKRPVISSDLQDFVKVIETDDGEYDEAIFKFKRPLIYNEFSVVHIRMELDDSDHSSKLYSEQRILEKVQLVNFRIELRHLQNNKDARLMRRRINTTLPGNYEIIKHVPFNTQNKSYEACVYDPSVNYSYRLEWF